jgi:acyl carrier protein
MEDEIKPFIVALLSKKAPLPPGIQIDSFRYLDYGQVDSMGLVKFVVDLEDRFDIELSAEDTQSDEFRYVGGLAALIQRKLKSH